MAIAGTEAVERGRGRQRDARERREEQHGVEEQQGLVAGIELAHQAVRRGPDDRAQDGRGRRDDRDAQDRHQQRDEHRPPRERARQQDLERAALPFARDRGRREPDGVDDLERDGDRVPDAERDRGIEAEDARAEQPQEGLRDDARLDQRLHLPAEGRVDDRHQRRPDPEGDGDHGDARALRAPGLAEERAADHCARPAAARPSRGALVVVDRVQLEEGVLEAGRLDQQVGHGRTC